MTRLSHDRVRRIAVIGTGVIGMSWTAYFLSRGLEVVATDPAPGGSDRLKDFIDQAWPTLERLGLGTGADKTRWRFVATPEAAVEGAEFVQENAPEREDLKRELFGRLDKLLPPDIVIASSASGLLMTPLQQGLAHPERCILAHPFNPPHIVPLVEVSGGELTAPDTLAWAVKFYEAIGKVAIRLNREMPGHVASRLQGALWQEAVSLVEQGVVSVEDADKALAYGPGLRFAVFGAHMTFHLAGGQAGFAHFLKHLGPSQERRWGTLGRPKLTPEVQQKLIDGVNREAAGRSITALEAERDACLVEVIEALRRARQR